MALIPRLQHQAQEKRWAGAAPRTSTQRGPVRMLVCLACAVKAILEG